MGYEIAPGDNAPRYLILARDGKYEGEATEVLQSMSSRTDPDILSKPLAKRGCRSCRRELLDQVMVFNEAHLRRLVCEYLGYYHADRIHDGLGKDTPEMRPVERREAGHSTLVALPRVGGLHHRYTWHLAA
jgi:putative transposase